ncbi:MAG: hypothetical protein E7503_03040 [Ruminococcus sp.]|nr:hypothetical protein [Ruminococcus sp.]
MRTISNRLILSILAVLLFVSLLAFPVHGETEIVTDTETLAAALYQRTAVIEADAARIDSLLEEVLSTYPVLGFDFNGYEGAIRGEIITMEMDYRNAEMLPVFQVDSVAELQQTVATAAILCCEEVHILMPVSMRDQDVAGIFNQTFAECMLARTMLSSRSWEIWINNYTDALYMSLKLEYEEDPQTLLRRKQQTEAEALRLARSLYYKNADDAVLALLAHDALVNRCAYNDTVYSAAENHSAYGALINGNAVCEGYAEAYQLLMDIAGIECLYVEGDASERHGWNMIRLEDGYYHVDATWDDPVAEGGAQHLLHDYFLVDDEKIGVTHTWNVNTYPAARGGLWDAALAKERLSLLEEAPVFFVQYTPRCDAAAVQAYQQMVKNTLQRQIPAQTELPKETTSTESSTTQSTSESETDTESQSSGSSGTSGTKGTSSTEQTTSAETTTTTQEPADGVSKGALYLVWGILIVFALGILYAKFIH